MRRVPGLCLIAIVWITRPCVAYSTKLNYEVFGCVTYKTLPFYFVKHYRVCEGEFEKEGFHGLK